MITKTFVGLFIFNMLVTGSIGLGLVSLLVYAPFVFVFVVVVGIAGMITCRQIRKQIRKEIMIRRLARRW
jgi:NO-binding membrane sensor protein with MHYT domain